MANAMDMEEWAEHYSALTEGSNQFTIGESEYLVFRPTTETTTLTNPQRESSRENRAYRLLSRQPVCYPGISKGYDYGEWRDRVTSMPDKPKGFPKPPVRSQNFGYGGDNPTLI